MLPTQLLPSLLGLPTEEHVDLLFDPVFVIRLVCLCISSVNQTAEVCQIVNKIKQLADIVCDGRAVGIHPLQMFFIHFTNTFHALIHRLIVSISPALWPLGRLYQQNGVRLKGKNNVNEYPNMRLGNSHHHISPRRDVTQMLVTKHN